MEVKFKRLTEEAIMPIRAHKGDAGIDLTCIKIDQVLNEARQVLLCYHTGLAVEIPEGYVGLLFPRSGIWKKSLTQTNCVGVIDSSYRGEIMAIMKPTTDTVPSVYQQGERFCQLVIVPLAEYDIVEAAELSETDRGTAGFGSTGDKNETPEDTNTTNTEETATDENKTEEAE